RRITSVPFASVPFASPGADGSYRHDDCGLVLGQAGKLPRMETAEGTRADLLGHPCLVGQDGSRISRGFLRGQVRPVLSWHVQHEVSDRVAVGIEKLATRAA